MLRFSTIDDARQNGWEIAAPEQKSSNGTVTGKKVMGLAQRIFQGIFASLLYFVTCGNLPKFTALSRWMAEVKEGKIFRDILIAPCCAHSAVSLTGFVDPVKGIDMSASEIEKIDGIIRDSKLKQHHIDESGWNVNYSTYQGNQTRLGGNGRADAVLLPNHDVVNWNWKWQEKENGLAMNHDGSSGSRLMNRDDVRHYILEPCAGAVPSVIILTMGRGYGDKVEDPGVLQVQNKLVNELETISGVKKVLVLKTQIAVERYNELAAKGISVAAMIHTTC